MGGVYLLLVSITTKNATECRWLEKRSEVSDETEIYPDGVKEKKVQKCPGSQDFTGATQSGSG